MYVVRGYVSDKKHIEEYLEINNKEIKGMEKKIGSAIAAITELKAHVRIDTLTMVDSIYIVQDSIFQNDFKYNNQWVSLQGTSYYQLKPMSAQTTINEITMDIPLEIGMTENNQWFARPRDKNPYVNFTSIEAVSVKHKRWGMGPTLTLGAGYGGGAILKVEI